MTVCFFGESCTGKSTEAEKLKEKVGAMTQEQILAAVCEICGIPS